MTSKSFVAAESVFKSMENQRLNGKILVWFDPFTLFEPKRHQHIVITQALQLAERLRVQDSTFQHDRRRMICLYKASLLWLNFSVPSRRTSLKFLRPTFGHSDYSRPQPESESIATTKGKKGYQRLEFNPSIRDSGRRVSQADLRFVYLLDLYVSAPLRMTATNSFTGLRH